MNHSLKRPALPLLLAGALLALGACAQTGPATTAQDISTLSPLQLVGLSVQSADGTRTLGSVDDLVMTQDHRVRQVIVGSGAPMYPNERKVLVDTGDLRYAPNRQAVILVGMSPTDFAALPMTHSTDQMMSMGVDGQTGLVRSGVEPTNWTAATVPR